MFFEQIFDQFYEKLEGWLWSKDIWYPNGIKWKSTKNISYPQIEDLYLYPIPFAILLIVLRILTERYLFKPLGQYLGVKVKKKPSNSISNGIIHGENENLLEKVYLKKRSKFLKSEELEDLSQNLHIDTRQIERWIRRRSIRDKPTTLDKFSESSWRFCYYFISLNFGLIMLWRKSWFWDLNHCWVGYPLDHVLTKDVWWYYMLGSAYYWAQSFSHFFDVRRKDFWQMFLHHILAVSLLGYSWMCNYTRIGTLVLCLHDVADLFMELTKCVKYAEYQKLCNFFFGIFSLSWIITRVLIFPLYIIKGAVIGGSKVSALVPGFISFMLLASLFCLHCFWTVMIFNAVVKSISAGNLERDTRSSSEENDSEIEGKEE